MRAVFWVRLAGFALSVWLCLALSGQASAGGRIALVIGNSAYRSVPALDNPANDAEDISKALRSVGFDVIQRLDATRADMTAAVRDFSERVQNADIAVFYYAGHGLQMEGENYLVPVDAKIETPADVRFNTLNQVDVQQELAGARVSIIILDACRTNPFAAKLAGHGRAVGERGLGRVDTTGAGSLIVFSTQPNNVALDGAGRNSPFAAALVKHITAPGLEVRQMISRVRADVLDETKQKQLPWDNSSLVGEVYLAGNAPVATATPSASPALTLATPTPTPTTVAPAGEGQKREPSLTGVAAECAKIAAPLPNFADPAVIKASRRPRDWGRALGFCKQALEDNPNSADLHYFLGESYYWTKGYINALRQFTLAADAGQADAESQLGYMFVTGTGVVKDYHRAFDYFSKAAAAGNAVAIGDLGSMYSNGFGLREDDAQALAMFEKAIEAGSPFALVQTGVMYYNGKGAPRDYGAAEQYFQQAADLGDGYAMKFLAVMYERGLLGPPDPNQAAQLRLRAAEEDPNSETPDVPMPKAVAPQPARPHAVRRVRYYRYFVHNCWPLC